MEKSTIVQVFFVVLLALTLYNQVAAVETTTTVTTTASNVTTTINPNITTTASNITTNSSINSNSTSNATSANITTTVATTTTTPAPWTPDTSLESAYFLGDGVHLNVTFNNTLTFGPDKAIKCSNYFDERTLSMIGDTYVSAICSPDTSKSVLVKPAWHQFVIPGNLLHANSTYFINSSIVISDFTNGAPKPQFKLSGWGENLCSCNHEDLLFNIDSTINNAYGSLRNIKWSLAWKAFLPIPPPSSSLALPMIMSSTNVLPLSSSISISSSISSSIQASSVTASTSAVINNKKAISSVQVLSSSVSSSISTPPSSSIYVPTGRIPPYYNFTHVLHEQQGHLQIKLPAQIFEQFNVYELIVTGYNVFGQFGYAFKNLSFTCGPSSQLHRVAHEDLFYEIVNYYPKCWTGDRNRTYEWDYTPGTIQLIGGSTKTTINIFRVSRSSLTANTNYEVSIKVNQSSKMGSTELSNTFSYQPMPLQAIIHGDQISIGINKVLVLDSSMSHDPDQISNLPERRQWICTGPDGSTCKMKDNSTIEGTSVELKLALKDTHFKVGKMYTFKLTYSKGSNTVESQVSVKIENGDQPQFVVSTMRNKVSLATPVLFTAELIGNLSGSVSYAWSCYDKNDMSKKDVIPQGIIKSGTIRINDTVYLPRIRLSSIAIPRKTFSKEFEMVCRCNSSSRVASATVRHTKVNAPSLSIEPTDENGKAVGYAYSTVFALRVHRLISGYDHAQLLSFRFGYYPDKDDMPVQYLTGWTSRSSINNIRFSLSGENPSSTLRVFAQIRNDRRIVDYVESSVTVNWRRDDSLLWFFISKTKENLKYDIFEIANLLTHRVRLEPNIRQLQWRNVIKFAGIQYDFKLLIDYFMVYPTLPEVTDLVINTVAFLVQEAHGRVHHQMRDKIIDMLHHITTPPERLLKLNGDIDYGKQANTVLKMIETLLEYFRNVDQVTAAMNPILRIYALKVMSEQDSPFYVSSRDKNIATSKFDIYFTHFIYTDSSTTIFKIDDVIQRKTPPIWECIVGDSINTCAGFYISQVKYEGTLYDKYLKDRYTGGAITYVYQVDAWFLHPIEKKMKPLNWTENGTWIEVNFPLKDKEVLVGDDVQCLLWDDAKRAFNESECMATKLMVADKVTCKCRRLGFMTARRTPFLYPPTTQLPYPGANLTYDMYFYADEERCTNARLFGFFKPKLKAQLCPLLGIEPKRMKITGCTAGSIIVHFYILDVVGQVRNSVIKPIMDKIIEEQTFRISFNQGDDIWMFDVKQTTPKPPPPTIPPVGEVTVDWLPIGISIGALSGLFLFCIIFTYTYHTKMLRKREFTKVNSDKVKMKEEEETKDAKQLKREKQMNIKSIVHEDLNDLDNSEASVDVRNQSAAYKRSTAERKRKRSSIGPVSDSNAIASTASGQGYMTFQAHHQSVKEPPRLALDDEDDVAAVANMMKERRKKFQSKAKNILNMLQATNTMSGEGSQEQQEEADIQQENNNIPSPSEMDRGMNHLTPIPEESLSNSFTALIPPIEEKKDDSVV